jgi:hypothetical protein
MLLVPPGTLMSRTKESHFIHLYIMVQVQKKNILLKTIDNRALIFYVIRAGDSNSCLPDQELGALTKELASQLLD